MLWMVCLILLIALSALPVPTQYAKQEQNTKQEPSAAHQFALKDLGGRVIKLSDYKGKVVLLNFWATWCAPCRAEMPALIKLQKEYQSRGLQVLGITYPDYRLSAVQKVARQLKVNYPIVLGRREEAAKYGV